LAKENRVVDVCNTSHIPELIAQADITSVTYVPQLLLEAKVAGLGKLARVALNSIDHLKLNMESVWLWVVIRL
jgi:hypothetical protein